MFLKDYNFQAKIDEQEKTVKPINTSAAEFGWQNYYHLRTIHDWLDLKCQNYSEILKPLDAGRSYEGHPLKGVKLSKKANNTAVFIEGGIHAREWISPATATFILNELLTSQDKDVQYIAENFDWIFFPVINPDGYKATFEKDRMWRKTRQPFGICRGTDLNRNWASAWNKTGSSPDPCAYVRIKVCSCIRIISHMKEKYLFSFIGFSIKINSFRISITGLRRPKGVE